MSMTLSALSPAGWQTLATAPLVFERNAVTAALENIPGVAGPLQILTEGNLRSNAQIAIFDRHTMSASRIENEFKYPMLEILEDFPEAEIRPDTYRRPLAYLSFGELSRDTLHVGLMETHPHFHGKGVGVVLYRELASLAQRGEYRFVGHFHNNLEIAGFFLRRGCYFLEEIRPELQAEFRPLRDQENDPAVFHTVYFTSPADAAHYVPEATRQASVKERMRRRESPAPATVQSLHFLVHPLFVSDPVDADDSDMKQGYVEARALTDLYLEKARSLPEDGVLFLFSHLDPHHLSHPYSGYRALYKGFLESLRGIMGNRLFLRDDREVFDDLKVAGSLNAELRRRGFRLAENPAAYAYGECPELCVADASENLREGFDLEGNVVIETRYSNWRTPYRGESPNLERELRERGIELR